jgi:hypothetical protein
MGLFSFPDPLSDLAASKLEKEAVNSILSAAYSSWITFLWTSGQAKWADWSGEGKAMKNAATSAYLSLRELEKKGFLTLTVPTEMLSADNLSKFQTEQKSK